MSLEAGLKGVGGIAQQQQQRQRTIFSVHNRLWRHSSTSNKSQSLYNNYRSPQLSGEIDDIDDERTSSAGSGLAILKTSLRIGSSVSLFIDA